MSIPVNEYVVTVEQITEDENLVYDDRLDNPTGEHYGYAHDEEEALDNFHHSNPISCLDDFKITVKLSD